MGAVQLPNLCGPRSVMLSFEDSWGGKFGRGDNIKVVIGSQWIWTILRPLQWSSQLGEEASTTANGSDQLFYILKEIATDRIRILQWEAIRFKKCSPSESKVKKRKKKRFSFFLHLFLINFLFVSADHDLRGRQYLLKYIQNCKAIDSDSRT